MVWDDHEVANDYASLQRPGPRARHSRARRAAAYRAYWEHMPFPKSARPGDADMRIVGRLDWGRLARIHLLDDRQYRDPQACPQARPRRLEHGRARRLPGARRPEAHAARRRAGALARRRLGLGAALEPGRAADADGALRLGRPGHGGGAYWTDGWDGYAPARNRLLGTVAERKQVPGVVVLGGDVHSNYVADLKADFDDPRSPVVASEFCGTSITSLSLAQSRIDAARAFNPHIRYGRADQRGYVSFELDAKQLQRAPAGGRPAARSGERHHDRGALRRRRRPGRARRRRDGRRAGATVRRQNRPDLSAAPSTAFDSSLNCASTSLDGGAVAFAVHTSRPLGDVGDAAVRGIARSSPGRRRSAPRRRRRRRCGGRSRSRRCRPKSPG